MSKSTKVYICQKCGKQHLRWQGRCERCGEWNSLVESQEPDLKSQKLHKKPLATKRFDEIDEKESKRYILGISEYDRVLGGGMVPGQVILLAGEPGIGKSTLVLQVVEAFDRLLSKNQKPFSILYISGEESGGQIKLRLNRLKIKAKNLEFLAETDVDEIIPTILARRPKLVIVDSIQTMATSSLPSLSGSVVQVRESAQRLAEVAKQNDICLILIGHVTKEGVVAGPKTLEHLVDTVLYLEGDRYHSFRLLRSLKNRFGPAGESGVFEMGEFGLCEVKNPSALFLEERQKNVPGSAIVAALEGTRVFLIEVQALCQRTNFGNPRRVTFGFDFNRLILLLATLSRRAGLPLENMDVYLNVAGGFKLEEPAADLGVCLAIASAVLGRPVDPDLVAVGEVGLSGEVRSVSSLEKRIYEGQKLGFEKVMVPKMRKTLLKNLKSHLIFVTSLNEAISRGLVLPRKINFSHKK